MPDDTTIPWESAAVLVWTLPGASPAIAALDPMHVQTPPHPNPVPFWRFSDAVEHATETIMNGRHQGKEPWIKVAETLFGPMDVNACYKTILANRGGH
jgi:hypothetical protein